MDHRPYETWLLDDERLTAGQERELHLHLQGCAQCAALSRANRTLRAAPMSVPPAGFALRFQERLAAERKAQHLRNILGIALILVVGIGVVLWLVPTYLTYASLSPAQLGATWIANLMVIGLALLTMLQTGNAWLAAAFVPSYVWILAFALLVGIGFFWLFSSRRFTRFLQMRGRRDSATPGDQT
jgi:hypothetical protein